MFPKNGETKPEIRFDGFTSDWKECRLGEVKDVRDGTHDSPKYQNKGFPLITSKNIKESGLDMSNVSLISFEDFNAINQRSKVDIGDIIFGMIGTIGNPIILERDDFAIKNVALLKNGGSIDNRFLLQLLKSPVFELYMKKENAGGTQKFLGLSQIRNLNFLVPELSEQKKIGEFFSQLDKLLTLYQRKVEHLQEQKKSLLKQMFI
jgi:type I restriction enzyme S subunit